MNINRLKRSPAIREEQKMKNLIANNHEHEPHINDITNKNNVPITIESNGNIYKELARVHSNSTTSTSTVPLSFIQRLRNHRRQQQFSFDEEYDLIMNLKNNTRTNSQQHEMTIREDDCNGEHNNTKSVLLRESYFDWFKNFIGCH
jgi:hypothetical protein